MLKGSDLRWVFGPLSLHLQLSGVSLRSRVRETREGVCARVCVGGVKTGVSIPPFSRLTGLLLLPTETSPSSPLR